MSKEKRILAYISYWLLTGFIVCFIGLSNVFADELEGLGYISDKSDIQVVVPYNGAPLNLEQYGQYQLDVVDELLIFINNYNFSKDTIYQLEMYLPNANLTNANYFTVSGITTSSDEIISCSAIKILQDNKKYTNFRWRCNQEVDSLTFTIKNSNNENIVTSGIFSWHYTYLWNVVSTTDNSDIIAGLGDVQQSIIDSNKETQDIIKDQFNSCGESSNLYVNIGITKDKVISNTGTINDSQGFAYSDFIKVEQNKLYNISWNSNNNIDTLMRVAYYDENKNFIERPYGETPYSFTTTDNTYYIRLSYFYLYFTDIELTTYACTNKLDDTNAKLDEANETSKGILATLKDLPNIIIEKIKGLFIPEDGYFELWFNDLKMFFEDKLGFLATPFTIIIDFVNRYLDLNPTEDIIINIPDITVPNFEDYIIVKATTFNWSQLLKSKDSLNTLWQLYLSFVDVFLILNFINLCENKYNRIFGGDTTQYEYYTVEDSYNVDVNTGEIKSQRRNERTTTRKKVN